MILVADRDTKMIEKHEQIKKEMLSVISIVNKIELIGDMLEKVNNEIEILSSTLGIGDKNNLESFYDIWKKNNGNIGSKNDINSWVAYGLGMTTLKPNGEFLPPRRVFARAGFPDIDSDFDDLHRDDVYNYIIEKYGRENVGNIGTYNSLKLKSCIKRMGKVFDVANAYHKGKEAYITDNAIKVEEITKSLPKQMGAILTVQAPNGEEVKIKTIQDAYTYCPDFKYYIDKFPQLLKVSKDIEGIGAIISVHASGIVISDLPLASIAPLRQAKKDNFATQYAAEDLEALGLIKFDILGLQTLTIIAETLKMIKANYGIDIDIEKLPFDDKKTFDLYRSGNLTGVFQCDKPGMQKTIRQIQPDTFEDISAAIALYRPGPMANIPIYCSIKKGEREPNYFHASIEKYVKPILEDTHSVIVYQEQIMQICNSLAGFSITDGYVMIKAIGKKKQELMNRFENDFINGCVKNNVPKDVAKQYWDKYITPFSLYGFNRSHSVIYAINSYICCYLKANYTDEYMVAFLNVVS
jgi:DNA polymerase-3 subunit alpha